MPTGMRDDAAMQKRNGRKPERRATQESCGFSFGPIGEFRTATVHRA